MRLFHGKKKNSMCADVEDTFDDASKMTAMDFEDEDVKRIFIKSSEISLRWKYTVDAFVT